MHNDQLLLKKSENGEFNAIVFSVRNITEVVIPNNIICIGPYSFDRSHDLDEVEISSQSDHNSIEKYAFFDTCTYQNLLYNDISPIYIKNKLLLRIIFY